jgi:hypothetical protein
MIIAGNNTPIANIIPSGNAKQNSRNPHVTRLPLTNRQHQIKSASSPPKGKEKGKKKNPSATHDRTRKLDASLRARTVCVLF